MVFAQNPGHIQGQVSHETAGPLEGVTVILNKLPYQALTNARGEFVFRGLAPGLYTLSFSRGNDYETQEAVEVIAGATTEVHKVVDWKPRFAADLTVYSASRRTEKITDAPAAVTLVTEQEIERQSASGQLPRLLEFTPGVEITQTGVYWFNFNTRAFNSALNRRVLVLIDGRDPSIPYLGAQEWFGVSFPLDDLASAELVHGPGSALYGADSFNGVLGPRKK